MTPVEHKRLVETRRKNSLVWQGIHIFGSLGLAISLLTFILIVCAVATFVESRFDTKVAQAYVYRAPWFVFWLALLCVNLACVTFTRLPWQRKHHGFVITHAGIIIMLIGAMVGFKQGYEASVTLQKGVPANRLVAHQTVIQVAPEGGGVYTLPIDVEARQPKEGRPRIVPLPETRQKLAILEYTETLVSENRLVPVDAGLPGNPGVALEFSSRAMNQTLPLILIGDASGRASDDFFGQANILLVPELPDLAVEGAKTRPVRETAVVLAFAEPPVIRAAATQELLALDYRLSAVGEAWLLQIRKGEELLTEFRLPEEQGQEKTLAGSNLKAVAGQYWPDFVMEDGMPATKSAEPKNPAVLLNLTGEAPASWILESGAKPTLELAMVRDGEVAYRFRRSWDVIGEGVISGETVLQTGWADWQVRLTGAHERARMLPQWVNRPETSPADGIVPGIRAALLQADGTPGPDRWISSGTSETFLVDGREPIRIGYGLKALPIPFEVTLLNFEVPRDEGTETPANFISTVRFTATDHEPVEAVVQMNHPASFPPEWWRQFSGFTYKFSQASWNPENLDETTLQVLYDPGWWLKWIGSLMICVGITMLFYLKPKTSGKRGAPAKKDAADLPQKNNPEPATSR